MTLQVRAAVCHAAGQPLSIETVQLQPPQADEVLIEIKASGLCHSDYHQMNGSSAPYPFPVIPGHEGAGVVIECGREVTSVRPGDHVVPLSIAECGVCGHCRSGKTNLCEEFFRDMRAPSHFSLRGNPVAAYSNSGTFANFVVMNEHCVAKIREDVPFDIACYVGCGVTTGLGAVLHTARVEANASVVVIGLGGIGLNVLQGARLAGARQIVAVDINPGRERLARKFGATDFINPRDGAGGDLVERVRSVTGGGADYSFECVGDIGLMRQAFDCTHVGWGVCTIIGVPPAGAELALTPFNLLLGRTLRGSFLGNVKTRSQLPALLDLYAEGRINLDDLITHRLPLERINEGFELMLSGAAIRAVIQF